MSVVIPTLDEEGALRDGLAVVVAAADKVVVSDGGSRDRTVEVAARLGASVVSGPPGRGRQLNRGAAASTSGVLVFLHADTRLPAEGLDRVRQAIAEGSVGGAFAVRFASERRIFRLGSALVNLRTRLTGVPLGDQAQFVERGCFAKLGGFADWPILEDLDFGRRLKRAGRTVLLRPPVTTSARRFVAGGIARTIATNYLIWALYFAGVPPARLARLYRPRRRADTA